MNAWIRRIAYALVLAAVLVGTVLITMPVQFMVVQFGLPDDVRVGHLSGTLWSGNAVEIAYQGKIGRLAAKDRKMSLTWQWCPGWGRGLAALCVRVDSPLLKGEGTFMYTLFGGDLEVRDARFVAMLRDGYPLDVGPLKMKLKGDGKVNLSRLTLDPDDPRLLTRLRADGEVQDLRADAFSLGDYLWRATLEEGAEVTSEFSGGGDRFRVKGRASFNLADRSYRYAADLNTEDQGLLGMLKDRATKSEKGTLTFSGDGKLK